MSTEGTTGFFDETYETEQLPDPLPESPFGIFKSWFDESKEATSVPNSNAMCLSTVDAAGQPSSRMVLCKEIIESDGAVVFYTNRRSRKARELEGNPRCALLFHWDEQGRQVRFEGRVTKAPDAMSDAYFASRRWESRLGAHASDQSEPIESRDALIAKVMEKALELDLDLSKIVDGDGRDLVIPRPEHWGGYLVWVTGAELWCDGAGRVHERARWDRDLTPDGDGFRGGPWRVSRLQP
jgi:pyridoxamine 5'-phosphate oxidase